MYIDKLNEKVDRYNNIYQRTIKLKSIDVKSNSYIEFDVENNDINSYFKIGYHVKILKYKNISAKGFTPNCD